MFYDSQRSRSSWIGRLFAAMISMAAIFGVLSAAIIFFAPELLQRVQSEMSAFGAKGYKIPETPHLVPNPEADVKVMKAFSKVFVNIAKSTRPALVYIVTSRNVETRANPMEEFFFPFGPGPRGSERGIQQGAGSGYIVDLANGYIVTNHHVVEGATSVSVTTFDDRQFKAKVVGSDKNVDVGVIKLENFTPGSLKQVGFADSDKVEVGDWSVALGAPFELPQTLTVGVVSALGRGQIIGRETALEDFIQTDAAINPGNSGGPLLNIDGQVIGMNTAIYSRTGSSAGIGFAVPSNMVKLSAEMLISEGKLIRGYLGVYLTDFDDLDPDTIKNLGVNESSHGTLVAKVATGSPAEKAGLKPYDIVLSLNGNQVLNSRFLRTRVAFLPPNSQTKLGILRDGKKMDVTVTLGTAPTEPTAQRDSRDRNPTLEPQNTSDYLAEQFGLRALDLTAELRAQFKIKATRGAIVMEVNQESPARAFKRGDVITEINRKPIKGVKDLEAALKSIKQKNKDSETSERGRRVLVNVEREGRSELVILQI